MKKTIWKFPIETTDWQIVMMPKGAEILTVQIQEETPYLWAIVNPELKEEKRHIWIYGTGHPIDKNKDSYIGTYQLQEGRLVFHVFE